MLIKYLPKPIRKLAEQRCAEFCKNYNCANLFGEKSIGELGNAFVFDATYEKREFWSLISSGDFTPYYAMYGLPKKWAIKCLPEWLDRKGKVINNDWYRCVKSIKDQLFGDDCSEYYHSNSIIYSVKKEGYTEITLSDWLAANPEKKEESEELINGNNIPIQEAEPPQFDPITKPKHYNSHPSGIECIEITQHHDFCTGNAIKYLWRQGLKDGENSVTDLKKAVWYIERKIKQIENSGK